MQEFIASLSNSYEKLLTKLTDWGDAIILNLPNFAIAVFVAIVAFFSTKYIKKAAVKTTSKLTSNKTVLNLVSNLTTVIFGMIVLFLILSIFNLNGTINKILATAGVLGLAIGLALQDPMNNLFSGVFMSVRELYKIGDLVETNNYFGTITDIDLRATKLMVPTGQLVVIPNKDVIQNPLKNYSSSGYRRVDIECGVSYKDNLKEVIQLVEQTLSEIPDIIKGKNVECFFKEFGGSSINFTARFWIPTTSQRKYLNFQNQAIIRIKKAFDANNIAIPFPITTLDFGIEGGVPLNKMFKKDIMSTDITKNVN